MLSEGVKRSVDIVTSLFVLVLSAPLMAVVAIGVRISLGSPVIFSHARPGLYTKPFQMYKFRTMAPPVDAEGNELTEAQRLTPLTSFLRRTSLDELPELVNVVRGDMSLVGPRPLLLRYLPYFTPEEMVRFDVRPGITGLAQISGRNDLPWTERLRLDRRYVMDQSILLDVKILLRTAWTVLSGSGFQAAPSTGMQDLDAERGGTPDLEWK